MHSAGFACPFFGLRLVRINPLDRNCLLARSAESKLSHAKIYEMLERISHTSKGKQEPSSSPRIAFFKLIVAFFVLLMTDRLWYSLCLEEIMSILFVNFFHFINIVLYIYMFCKNGTEKYGIID